MSNYTAKASQIRDGLHQSLASRGLACVDGNDTDGCPTLAVGPGTAGSKSAFLKFSNIDWPNALNALGLAAGAYGPERVQLVTEANPAAGAGADILDLQTLANITGDVFKQGCKVEWFQSAAGTAPAAAGITGNPAATYWPDLKQQLRSAQ